MPNHHRKGILERLYVKDGIFLEAITDGKWPTTSHLISNEQHRA